MSSSASGAADDASVNNDLLTYMKDGQVLDKNIYAAYKRGVELLSKEVRLLEATKGSKINRGESINRTTRRVKGIIPENMKIQLQQQQVSETNNSEFDVNSIPLLAGELVQQLTIFTLKNQDDKLDKALKFITTLYDFDESCIEDIKACRGTGSIDPTQWFAIRYGSVSGSGSSESSVGENASYYDDKDLQLVMPIVWKETQEGVVVAAGNDSLSAPGEAQKGVERINDGDRDYYRDFYDVEKSQESLPTFVKVQRSPFLCPFYYSLYNVKDSDTNIAPLKILFEKKRTIVLAILELMESKMSSSFQTLIGYVTENDIDPEQKEEILKNTRISLIQSFVFLGLCNYIGAHEIRESYGYTKADEWRGFIFDQVVENDFSLDKYLTTLRRTTITEMIAALKKVAESEFSLKTLERVSYVYRGFRKLSETFSATATADTSTKAESSKILSKETYELFFKKKGNEFLSQYEDVSSSLRVYIRINTGPPPGVTSPFYEGVRNVTSLKPYAKKRSCQSIEDCSVAPAIKASSGKSIIYRKSEGYDGVFHRMMASDKNPINTQDLFKECYSSVELLKNVSIPVTVSGSEVSITADAKEKFQTQLGKYLNTSINSGNFSYDVSADPKKQDPKIENQIFVTLATDKSKTEDRILCQVTKIVLEESENWKLTVSSVEQGGALPESVADMSKNIILYIGNMKSISIASEEDFSKSNEGMTVASFGEFQEVYESVNRHMDRGYDANKEIYYGNCSYLIGFTDFSSSSPKFKVFNVKLETEYAKPFCDAFDRQQSYFLNKAVLIDDSVSEEQQPELNRLRLVPTGAGGSSELITIRYRDMMTAAKRDTYGKYPFQIFTSSGSLIKQKDPSAFGSVNSGSDKDVSITFENNASTMNLKITKAQVESSNNLPSIILHEYYDYTFSFKASEFKDFRIDLYSLGSLFYDGEILDDDLLQDREKDKNLFRQVQGQFLLNDANKYAFAIDTYDYDSEERKASKYFDGLVALKSTNEGLCDLVNLVKENCSGFTIFGYGYSGTGKSYTLFGDASKNLFERVRSCFELYVKNMTALGITSPQFMSLQMVINKIKATIVSTDGIPVYNVPRGDSSLVYGYKLNSRGGVRQWQEQKYAPDEIPFRYGLPHPAIVENMRLLQKKPDSGSLIKLDDLTKGAICLVRNEFFLIAGQEFLRFEKDGTVYAIPYYGNFNLDDILLCEDRNDKGELFACKDCKWDAADTIEVKTATTSVTTSVFNGSLVLKSSGSGSDAASRVIPIDDGIRFFIDDCISDSDDIDIWTDADNKKVMLIVSYLQWYILEDLYNTIELIGSRESLFLKKQVYDRLEVKKTSKTSLYLQNELLSSDERSLVELDKLPEISRKNKVTCLYLQQTGNTAPFENPLFDKNRKEKENRVLGPFGKDVEQKVQFLTKKKAATIKQAKEQILRFKELNAYVPNKGMSLSTGYEKMPIAEDKKFDDITYYDITYYDPIEKKVLMSYSNFNIMHYLVYKHKIFETQFDLSNGIAPQGSSAEIVLGFSRSHLITEAVNDGDDFKAFASVQPISLQNLKGNPWKIEIKDDNGNMEKVVDINESLFNGDKNLFTLLNYFFTLPDTDTVIEDFLKTNFSAKFNLSDEDKTKFVRLADIQKTLTELETLCTSYKSIIEDLAFVEALGKQISTKSEISKFTKKFVFDPTFYTSSGNGSGRIFTLTSAEKKTDLLDIALKLTSGKQVEGGYSVEGSEYVEQSLSYFHLFHIPTTKMETASSEAAVSGAPSGAQGATGKPASKGPVYGFVQLTMKNLIESGFTVKMYAAFDLYGTAINPDNDVIPDEATYLTNGTIKRYNFLKTLKRYEDDLLFGEMPLEEETNLINEMSESLVDVCERGFTSVRDITSFYELLQKIEKKRIEVGCIKPTPNNPQSSRGHLFLIFEVTKNTPPTETDDKWYSAPNAPPKKTYITVIDMAGVENPLTIAQKVNTFDKSKSLDDQKKSMFTWFGSDTSSNGFHLLEKKMARQEAKCNADGGLKLKISTYTKQQVSTPLKKEKEQVHDALKISIENKIKDLQSDIKNLTTSIESVRKSTFYTSMYTFFAGFKICDTIQTLWNLALRIIECAHHENALNLLDTDVANDANELKFVLSFQLKVNAAAAADFSKTDFELSELGINKKDDSFALLEFLYIANTLPKNISKALSSIISSSSSFTFDTISNSFSYKLKIQNKGTSYDFANKFFKETYKKLVNKFEGDKTRSLSMEEIAAYKSQYCSEGAKKAIEEEGQRAANENTYENYLFEKRINPVNIDSLSCDAQFYDSYTFNSFFQNYQKQENESGSFVDANFLFFRLKGFPLKQWLKTYLEKNSTLQSRFAELLQDTSSGIGIKCADGANGADCDSFASYLLVETLMDEKVFEIMLTLAGDFVKVGTKEQGIHNQEFLKRRAKDDFEKLALELEAKEDEIRKIVNDDSKENLEKEKSVILLKREVYRYLYYYTPWWGGSVLFKTNESGMGFSVNLDRLKTSYIGRIHDLQKHCLIALIEQIINEGYFINETISHIVTYFKHTSRGVSDAEPLRLHELKGGKTSRMLTKTTAAALPENGAKLKSANYFVQGSTQINPAYLLSDLETEYVPTMNPFKMDHFKKVYQLICEKIGKGGANKGTRSPEEEAKCQFLFNVYKSAFDLNETIMKSRKPLTMQGGGNMQQVNVNMLNGTSLKLLLLNAEVSEESVDKKLKQELSLDFLPATQKLVTMKQDRSFFLSDTLPDVLKIAIAETQQLKEIAEKLKSGCFDGKSEGPSPSEFGLYADLFKGPSENRHLFCESMAKLFENLSTKSIDSIFDAYSPVTDSLVKDLVQSLSETGNGAFKPVRDPSFELFSNYYRKVSEESEKDIDDFESALKNQLSNGTNTVKMIPLLQYLKNLTGGKCKYVMLCLIRPEIKAQYCEGARKGLQFAEAVASTSAKGKKSETPVASPPASTAGGEAKRLSKKKVTKLKNSKSSFKK